MVPIINDQLDTLNNKVQTLNNTEDVRLQAVNTTVGQKLDAINNTLQDLYTLPISEAVADWLEDHPEATTTVQDGSITEPKLSSELRTKIAEIGGSVVNVKDYGAINNDGVIDTEALQRCIDANPHATIFFPKGTYTIDEPIKCYSQSGGTFLFLGGVTIQARATMPYMFYFHKYDTDVPKTGVGPFGIFGGVLDANGMAEECIRSENAWVFRLTDVLCINFTVCGIRAIGGGLHHYTRIKCDIEQRFPWSEGTTTGIICGHVDSFFTDIQIMSCHRAIELIGGGHTFSGCYFMSRINYHLDPNVSWQGLCVYIGNSDTNSAALVTFNNCYFDSHIYVFYSAGTKIWDLDVNNCRFYLTYESQFDATRTYILGGPTNVNLRVRGAAIFSRTGCDTMLGRCELGPISNKNFVFEQNKVKGTYIGNIFNVTNLGYDGLFQFNSGDVTKDKVFYLGAILSCNVKFMMYKLSIGYGINYSEFIIGNKPNSYELKIFEQSKNFKDNFFEIIIDQTTKTETILQEVVYNPIYLKSKINGMLGNVKIHLEPLGYKAACIYFFNDTFRTGNYVIDNPFIIDPYKDHTLSNDATYYIDITGANTDVLLGYIDNGGIDPISYKLKVGLGGSYTEYIIRTVNNKFELREVTSQATTSDFFLIIIDQTPIIDSENENHKKYPIYLRTTGSVLYSEFRIALEYLVSTTVDNTFFKEGYQTGTYTINDPFILHSALPYAINKTVYFLGDSITAGVGCSIPFHEVFHQMNPMVKCLNYGVGSSGYYVSPANGFVAIVGEGVEGVGHQKTITEITRMIDIVRSLPETIPYCVIAAGTNDWGSSVPLIDSDRADGEPVTFRYMFDLTIKELSAKTSSILVVTPLKRSGWGGTNQKGRTLKEYSDAMIEIAQRYGAMVYDGFNMPFNPNYESNMTAFMPDGLHPNNVGHRKMAMALQDYIKTIIA